ncbi:hypothetical protein CHARACLAT_004661 [Characodon lateralis]|uniref:Secreted protein n=1 Tax=Characodon lateralis TaxID=208331 RepID=A0ABU7D487_9TELE|nr:hypothetical protein [Characodon lateralis]
MCKQIKNLSLVFFTIALYQYQTLNCVFSLHYAVRHHHNKLGEDYFKMGVCCGCISAEKRELACRKSQKIVVFSTACKPPKINILFSIFHPQTELRLNQTLSVGLELF